MAALDALRPARPCIRRFYAANWSRKGYDAGLVALLLEGLRAEKLLDDRRFTESFVAYHAARGQGPLRIRAELRRHGLEGALAEECLDAFPDWISSLRKRPAEEIWRAAAGQLR